MRTAPRALSAADQLRLGVGTALYQYDDTGKKNGLGRLTRLTLPHATFDMTYTARGQVEEQRRQLSLVPWPGASLATTLREKTAYNALGQVAKVEHADASGSGTGTVTVTEYDERGLPARLKAGGRVAEIGCGVGWSSISLARGFPRVRIDGVDVDRTSIKQARRNAEEAGLADRIAFHLAPAEEAPLTGPYDLVTAFECLHDMAYPGKALRRMRELAGPDGAVLVADEAVGDGLEENRNFIGRLNYNFSVLHCLPQALVYPDAAGTGTVLGPATLRAYAEDAGFQRVEVLPIENPLWRFYRLTP